MGASSFHWTRVACSSLHLQSILGRVLKRVNSLKREIRNFGGNVFSRPEVDNGSLWFSLDDAGSLFILAPAVYSWKGL